MSKVRMTRSVYRGVLWWQIICVCVKGQSEDVVRGWILVVDGCMEEGDLKKLLARVRGCLFVFCPLRLLFGGVFVFSLNLYVTGEEENRHCHAFVQWVYCVLWWW